MIIFTKKTIRIQLMKKIVALLCIYGISCASGAMASVRRTWYVSGKGEDANTGTSPSMAFHSLQKAADQVAPGDLVVIDEGIYTNNDSHSGSAVLTLKTSGRPDAWITWKAKPGTHPVINPKGWSGIQVLGSYQIIEGLNVTGANDSITLLAAMENAKNPKPDPHYNTNGITVDGRNCKPDEKPHHIIIQGCRVSKCPGGGITMLETDYVTVENCLVFDNAWYMRYAGSGITTLDNWAFDDKPGYHIIIRGNKVWNNKTMVAWGKTGKLSDGNGILLDVTDLAQGATNPNGDAVIKDTVKNNPSIKKARPEWNGRALIANNLSAYNGGSGIHTFRTRHVDIVNNTTYWNGQTVGYEELFANRSEDVVILNNIIIPRPGGRVTSNNRNSAIRWDYNIYPVAQEVMKGEHDRIADQKFIKVKTDILESDFSPLAGSPAVNSGTTELKQLTDINGRKRDGRPDRGCIEW